MRRLNHFQIRNTYVVRYFLAFWRKYILGEKFWKFPPDYI